MPANQICTSAVKIGTLPYRSVGNFDRPKHFTLRMSTEGMPRTEKDEKREERIKMEIIVDTYGSKEQAMGWYAYLDDTLDFPFEACCITEREESPLEVGETVRIVGMSPTEPTPNQML